jgi:hypothetical protein
MDRRTTRRLRKAASGLSGACLLVILTTLPAAAQVPDPGDLVEDVTSAVDDAANEAGDGVADAVEEVAEEVGGTVGGPAGETTEDAGSTAGDTVRDVTGDAGNAIGDTGAEVDDVVDDAVEGGLGGSEDPAPGPNNGGVPTVNGQSGGGELDQPSATRVMRDREDATTVEPEILVPGTAPGTTFIREIDDSTASREDPSPRSILDALGGITFPLALIAIVAAFLAIQGRIDKADPKLSVALLDPEDEMLSFR